MVINNFEEHTSGGMGMVLDIHLKGFAPDPESVVVRFDKVSHKWEFRLLWTPLHTSPTPDVACGVVLALVRGHNHIGQDKPCGERCRATS